jgi:hypothetical protein
MNLSFQYLQYDNYFWIALFFLILTTIFYFSKISEEKKNKIYLILFYLAIFVFTFWSLFLSLAQYLIWKNHQFSKYLLPPYQKIDYYLSYAYFHFWRDFIFRLIGILVTILLMNFLNFVFRRDIFYNDEKILVPYLSLFFRFPYNALFLFIGFLVLFLLIAIKTITINLRTSDVRRSQDRESFKQYWLYLALILFLLQPLVLSNYEFLKYTP